MYTKWQQFDHMQQRLRNYTNETKGNILYFINLLSHLQMLPLFDDLYHGF